MYRAKKGTKQMPPTNKLTCMLVGVHFHPPAKQLLPHLPAGVQLSLRAEPENPYDAEAVMVMLDPGQIPESEHAALDVELPNQGVTLEQLVSAGELCIGHIGATDGKPLAKARGAGEGHLVGTREVQEVLAGPAGSWSACMAFAPDGSPRVQIDLSTVQE